MKVCLIIINYNGIKYLPSYLDRISFLCQQNQIKLFITDDKSKDLSIAYLKDNNYEYTINEGPRHGFAANVNNGIRYAQSIDSFDYYIISNNDIEFGDMLFETLGKILLAIKNQNLKTGLIGFDEVLPNRRKDFDDFSYTKYHPELMTSENEIPGFFFIISNELIQTIGLMDEEYFMYGEDNDYYVRTYKAGFRILNTNLPVMHYSEGSSSDKKQTSWYVYRNAFLFAQKNLGLWGGIKILLSFINQIYNPFYTPKNPSNLRVTRNGFFYNNYLLLKSLLWNLNYYMSKSKNISL